nr:reverse transcriptase domain-containing protein [Tanacetum cinerariifolium]
MTVVANKNNELILTRLVTGWKVCIDYRKLNDATRKDHFLLPFIDQMLEREGIVLGHKISKSGIEVDRAKVDVISKLPYPTTVKGVRSFLGHAGFYHRFIQDFSKITRPMTHLLEKETPFVFSKECIDSFNTLKMKLTEAPILVVPDWNLPFELIMRTRSSSNLVGESSPNPTTSNPKRCNLRRSKKPFSLEESPLDTMVDQRTMAKLLRAPTEGYAEFDESFHEAWDRYKDLLRACPHHSFIELHQLDTFYNALNLADQDSLNAAAGGNLLERRTQDVLTIIENKSKVRNSRSKSIVSQVKACDVNSTSSLEIAKLTHAVNQQMSAMTTAMTTILKQFQATPPPASVKAVEETCVTCSGAHPYYQCLAAGRNTFPKLKDNIQGYVSAAADNYNQGNPGYRPQEWLIKVDH